MDAINTKRHTTVHDRFQIIDDCCGLVATRTTLAEASKRAEEHADHHSKDTNNRVPSVLVYDAMAPKKPRNRQNTWIFPVKSSPPITPALVSIDPKTNKLIVQQLRYCEAGMSKNIEHLKLLVRTKRGKELDAMRAIAWARQEVKDYHDLPVLGATSKEQYRINLERVTTLNDVLRIADAFDGNGNGVTICDSSTIPCTQHGNGDKLPSKHWNNKQPNPRHTGKIFSARKGMEEHDVYTWTMEHWRFDE
jgi:hypothetical protein